MHTYIHENGVWTVGIWHMANWQPIRDFKDERDAAAFASYLNGGQATSLEGDYS